MEIKFLEDSTENSIHFQNSTGLGNNSGEFEEPFILGDKKIVYIKWQIEEKWVDNSSDNYLQPPMWDLEYKEVEILSIIDIEGNEIQLLKNSEEKAKKYLENIDYSS